MSPSRTPRRRHMLAAFGAAAALVISACAAPGSATPAGSDRLSVGHGTSATGDLAPLRIAAIFSGPVTDADYNQLGLLALQAAGKAGAQATYRENTAVQDAETALREYVADGKNVIWTHGSQFYASTVKVALDNPDVTFIGEFDGTPPDVPPNVWTFDRQFHLGFYAIGVLASKLSTTGKIGYVGGLSLPFSFAEVHAMQQAITDTGAPATLTPVWTSDFNDPTKAQQITAQLINDGSDVIIGSLNNAAAGTFKAAAAATAEGKKIWVTAKYNDKSSLDSAGNYAGTVLYDFTKPLIDVLTEIAGGTRTGYYPIGFSTGMKISMPDAVPVEVRDAVTATMAKIDDGAITVALDTSKIN